MIIQVQQIVISKIRRRARIKKIRRDSLHLRSDNPLALVSQANRRGNVEEIADISAAAGFAHVGLANRIHPKKENHGEVRALKRCELRAMHARACCDQWITDDEMRGCRNRSYWATINRSSAAKAR